MRHRVEQAIFTSARGDDLDGYQLTARTAGVDDELARQLTIWGPAHDSLLDPSPAAKSLNFKQLDDAWFALSQTTRQGAEYSGRGGGRICTQFFLLPAHTMACFGHHPLLAWQALSAAGRVRTAPASLRELTAFTLNGANAGVAATVEASTLDPSITELANAVRNRRPAAVVGGSGHSWLWPLLAALQSDERRQLSFTTGLKPSTRRPFLICTLPDQPSAIRQAERHRVRVVRLSEEVEQLDRFTSDRAVTSAIPSAAN